MMAKKELAWRITFDEPILDLSYIML